MFLMPHSTYKEVFNCSLSAAIILVSSQNNAAKNIIITNKITFKQCS